VAVPSYDDLAPSIPDVHPRDTFDLVARLSPAEAPVVSNVSRATSDVLRADVSRADVQRGLFACVRVTQPRTDDALLALGADFSPRVERHGAACVVLDVAGLPRLLGDAQGIAREIARSAAERGVAASIAIAPTQTAALLLSLQRGATFAGPDAAAAVAPLPLNVLATLATDGAIRAERQTLGGAGVEGTLDILRRWGLRAVGEFAALPADDVAARFGRQGVALQRLACGIDPRPLIPDPAVPRFGGRLELEWPIEELEPLSFVFARLLDPLAVALERADRAAAAIRLDLRLVDRTFHTRALQLPAPIRDPRVLRTLLLLDLESHPPAAAIDIVSIDIDPAPARIVQYSLLQRAVPPPETLATLTARLSALAGASRCGSPVLLDSYRPDAFEMRSFEVLQGAASATTSAPRSTQHLDAPCQHPAAPRSTPILRRFRPPVAVRVAIEHGRPVQLANLRKGVPNGRIDQASGPWRSSGCWWTGSGEHWDRDEWDVALTDGSLCRIYQDRINGCWFLDAVID
jgi:protein ImuB